MPAAYRFRARRVPWELVLGAYFEKLCPESPKAVHEATRWTVPIDRVKVSGPILVVSSELDHLTPPGIGRSLATFYGADYRYLRGRGHNVLLEPNWRETASMVAAWLVQCYLEL